MSELAFRREYLGQWVSMSGLTLFDHDYIRRMTRERGDGVVPVTMRT